MNARQTLLIARYSARYSVRGGVGLVFLLLSLTFGLLVAHLMMQPVTMSAAQYAQQSPHTSADEATKAVLDRILEVARSPVAWVLSSRVDGNKPDAAANAWADYLLLDRPGLLSAIFLILAWGWPFIVSCGAFDLYAGDIASRQLRYQLLRADRGSIFFGRLLGCLFVFVSVLLLVGITVPVYMGVTLPVYGWGSLLGWAAYGTVAMVVLSLPYMALCAWISAAIGAPFTSLTVSSLVIGGVPLLATIGSISWPQAHWLMYLLPWGYQTRLFHPEPLQVVAAAACCLAMTALFLALGYRKFTRRDL